MYNKWKLESSFDMRVLRIAEHKAWSGSACCIRIFPLHENITNKYCMLAWTQIVLILLKNLHFKLAMKMKILFKVCWNTNQLHAGNKASTSANFRRYNLFSFHISTHDDVKWKVLLLNYNIQDVLLLAYVLQSQHNLKHSDASLLVHKYILTLYQH